jgi:hypothetical protein
MERETRWRVILAIILVLAGLYLFTVQFFPQLGIISLSPSNWPLLIVGVGAAFLVAALVTWTPGLMVPAAIIGGLGAIMFWQNATGNWASWAYAWALFPVFAGFGIFLMHAMQGNLREGLVTGGWLILIGLTLFIVFGSFFGGIGALGQYWPLVLIVLGVVLLAQGLWRRA